MTKCEEFMDWLTDQQIVHWTLTEETKDDPIAAVKALLQTQLDETYDPKISALAAKAALADEEWGGDIEGHISRDSDAMGRKSEECVHCGKAQWGADFGKRPMPHYQRCRKVLYDALSHEAQD